MNALVLGATGMLGHKLMQLLSHRFEVIGTVRASAKTYADHPVLRQMSLFGDVQAENFDSVVNALASARPAAVINCVGIVKQLPEAQDALLTIAINALFPHQLAQLCRTADIRLIHVSTDCVFSGRIGNYVESDVADAEDLYGRTKFLGEVSYDGCLTLRTSMIGRELGTSQGLLEWFLSQEGKAIRGYTRAIFSGFTTNALAEIIAQIITNHPDMQGIWHAASEPISKFDLLSLVKETYGLNIHIEPDDTVVTDRSLNADRFRKATGLAPPSWPDMVQQMYKDPMPYSEIRRTYAC
ncbi:MAG TPA: SDR family oxidoreductase [Anaerolineae bacterium]|nr:SDR family oxidoreductase [Anaerolineae bacterium]